MRLFLLACFIPLCAHAQTRDPSPQPYISYDLAEAGLFSADEVAVARAGSFTPTDVPLAFHLNPALLAGVGRSRSLVVSGDLSTEYGIGDAISTAHFGAALGTTVRVAGAPLALGVGVSRTSLDFDAIPRTSELPPETDPGGIEEINAYESDWSAAVGAGWSGPVEIDAGFGLHRRERGIDGNVSEGLTVDLGTVVAVPVFGRSVRGPLSPALDISLGYAQRHIGLGNELEIDGERLNVRSVRDGVLGYGARAGLDIAIGSAHVRAIEVDGRVEASAALADQALIGGMRLENALLGTGQRRACGPSTSGDDRCGSGGVTGRRAVRITLFDALSYSRGRSEEGDSNVRSSWGVSLEAGAALRLVGLLADDASLSQTGDRLVIRVSYAEDTINGFDFGFAGLTLGWGL